MSECKNCVLSAERAEQNAHLMRKLNVELKMLRGIAKFCKEEIDHGFDLPSEVFDRTEKYYDWRAKQRRAECCGGLCNQCVDEGEESSNE